jgi:hypothetical protein
MTVQSPDQGLNEVQPNDQGSPTEVQTPTEKATVTVNGTDYSSLEDIAKDYESLSKEFHKRNQAKPQPAEEPPEVAQARETLKSLGFVDKADLDSRESKMADELKLQAILLRNPDLTSKEGTLKELMSLPSNQGKAIEDIIVEFNLKPNDKLVKAKTSGPIVGKMNQPTNEVKNFRDLSKEEQSKYLDSLGKPGFSLSR